MSNWKLLSGVAAASIMTAAIVAPAEAQVTTSEVRGTVTNDAGAAVSGATVTIRDTQTGLTRSTTTSASGGYAIRNLPISSTYTVTVSADELQSQQVENVPLVLGDTTNLSFSLSADADRTLDTIVVTASATDLVQTAVGPNATFGLEILESAPAINRNITDILRIDPRVYVDESRGDINPVQCGGKNPRFNSLTLDGVRLNDGFGLNSNGYPTERQPFPFDAIEQVAVELSPFDVEYGGFTACNINAVTKSGTNEFHGSAFIDYTSDNLQGDTLEGESVQANPFDEIRYGAQIAGPIVKDKLFFSVAYEKLEGANTFDRGPIGSGAINEVAVTQAELDEIARIARDIYGYDVGEVPTSFDNEDEKLLVKLDWNINEQHRAAFTYNYNDGFNFTESDGDPDEFEFSNHLYERGTELNQYVGFLYSDWTDNFSTEVRVGYVDIDPRVATVGGTDFGEITIELGRDTADRTDDVDVYLGGDDSRQSNQLDYTIFNMAFKGFYQLDDHSLTFGYEREELDIFNLFVQHTETEIDFDARPGPADATDTRDPAIINFELGLADNVNYNNAPSGNPADAAADWGYAVNTAYIQDEFDIGSSVSVVLGLRYDWWETDDAPETNPAFVADYGFSNGQTLDGADLLQPRFAFTWDAAENVDVRGGFGLYSGGDPNVWLSNNYSNNNVLQFGQDGGNFGLEDGTTSLFDIAYTDCEDGVPVGPGWCVPTVMADAVAAGQGSNFEINFLDPDFEIPSEWKFALGATWYPTLPGGGVFGGEYVVNGDLLYSRSDNSAIVLRADLDLDADEPFINGYPQYESNREGAFVLTNAVENGNRSFTASVSVAKEYDNGFDWAFGYAYNDAEEVQPMTSSVAFSNYNNRAVSDPQSQALATSDYNIKHRFTLLTNYRKEFFGDYETTFSAFATARSGLPFSLAGGNANFGFFNNLEVLQPGVERNSEEGDWWTKVDIRVEQEFPGLRPDDRSSAFIVVDNFTNMINDDWGILVEPGFPPIDQQARVGDASLWQVRLGLRYEF
ncbi:MAG: TonB-dependent receptor [Hyphomonas sp.]|nr:TonB-dependent receptor [Hyphomonas sp.]